MSSHYVEDFFFFEKFLPRARRAEEEHVEVLVVGETILGALLIH
jgi:hypothetical protein